MSTPKKRKERFEAMKTMKKKQMKNKETTTASRNSVV